MKAYCCKCGKGKIVSPSVLKHHGRTEKTYICLSCFNKTKQKNKTVPNWNYFKALRKLAKEVLNE